MKRKKKKEEEEEEEIGIGEGGGEYFGQPFVNRENQAEKPNSEEYGKVL